MIPYILFNLFLAVGLRDLLLRLLAHKRIREVVFFLLVMAAALPQPAVHARPRPRPPASRTSSGRFLDRVALEPRRPT